MLAVGCSLELLRLLATNLVLSNESLFSLLVDVASLFEHSGHPNDTVRSASLSHHIENFGNGHFGRVSLSRAVTTETMQMTQDQEAFGTEPKSFNEERVLI